MNSSLVDTFSDGISRGQAIPDSVSRRKRLSLCVAAAVVGVSLVSVHDVNAAPKKSAKKSQSTKAVSDLEAENALLKAQLEAVQHERDSLKQAGAAGAVAPAAGEPSLAEPTAATAEPTETVAEQQAAETDNLGEVVVKARPKLAKLHDVTQSVSVVTGKELDRELALDLGAITRRASNVQFNQNNTRGASLSIRGVGKRSFTETQDPSVGITVDGVSYGLSQLANFSFYDVDSVEVTRGPRGTEGGLSASAGKVVVNSKAPTFTPTAEYSATYGEREALILKGAMGGGVIDDLLAWRGSFIVDKGRGFYENNYDSNYSLYNKDRLSSRVQLLFTPTSNVTAKLSADFEPKQPQLQNGLTFYHAQPTFYPNAPNTRTDTNGSQAQSKLNNFYKADGTIQYGPRPSFVGRGFTWADYIGGEQRNSVWFNENKGQTVSNQGASAQVDWDVAEHILSSNTAVREYSFDAHNDEGTPFDISADGGGGVNYTQFTQEFKIKNKPGGFVDYRAGLFGMKTHDDIDSKAGWGSDAGAWFANNAQYDALYRNAAPGLNKSAGDRLLRDSLEEARRKGVTEVNTLSGSIFAESDLHFTDALTLTTGVRVTKENRKTEDNINITSNGRGQALNPVKVRDVQLGGFNSVTSTSAANYGALTGTNSAAQLNLADSVAKEYFGATVTATPGAAYNSLTVDQQKMVGHAKTLRQTQFGQLYQPVSSDYDDILTTAQFTPSYKINDNINTYISWQYGEKSGSALNVNGVTRNVKPEITNAAEIGFKTFWLDKSIIFNIDAFVMDVKDYQQTVQVVDTYQTALNNNGLTAYASAQGNVNKVRVHGVELDSVYNLIPNLSMRLSGAYNIAQYIDYKNAGKPDELGYLTASYVDFSGATLPGANKWSFVVGAEYTRPVFDKFNFHTSFNTNFQSGYNNADNLSVYGNTDARSLTDFAIGVGTKNNMLDVSFIAKNLFNNNEHEEGWNSYSPNPYPAWFGVQLSGKI